MIARGERYHAATQGDAYCRAGRWSGGTLEPNTVTFSGWRQNFRQAGELLSSTTRVSCRSRPRLRVGCETGAPGAGEEAQYPGSLARPSGNDARHRVEEGCKGRF